RKAVELLRANQMLGEVVFTVGKKGPASLARLGYTVAASFPLPSGDVAMSDALAISSEVRRRFEAGEIDVAYLVYTRFHSVLRLVPVVQQLLPLQPPEEAEAMAMVGEYLFEPEPRRLLASLLPRYLDAQVYQALVESVAAEHAARMTAMRNASDNAAEMIDRLTLNLNRARQAAITREIAEIVGGADALKG
ncbi:MAG: FoF1 ATP synthase subunit gamma, partial [Armatimonadota bacterium]|nr:FoF1 ATP synthase subunit gamma [Armatimonadota bacterium]